MRRVVKILLWSLLILLLLVVLVPIGVGGYLLATADLMEPALQVDTAHYEVQLSADSVRRVGDNSLRKNEYGLWEARIVGTAQERGAVLGLLARDLIEFQERVFVDAIYDLVSSERYVRFLHKLVRIFNGRMAQHIPLEFREEIAAMALSCSHRYDAFGSPYERQINYHAAHDIGHAMQDYMLVGCSSFAVWGTSSEDGELLVGRNFDFYVGDDFARNKLVLAVEPSEGHCFVSVTWPGMVGVLSGMNERGLTVTINAAKGALPTSTAMPISLLAREILQFAATIDEAYAIAQRRQTFVSESLLIASAEDRKAAVIEKSPEKIALRYAEEDRLISTNHYLSETFADEAFNRENIATSDSPYRYARIEELLSRYAPLTAEEAAAVLRDRRGVGDRAIGLTNEKALNQCISHHGVIFQPEKRLMWLSTAPWQAGAMLCYDLNQIFANDKTTDRMLYDPSLTIEADTTFLALDYLRVVAHRALSKQLREALDAEQPIEWDLCDSLLKNNPHYYGVYDLVGDVAARDGAIETAITHWQRALECEIPRLGEREAIEQKITDYGTR